MHKFSADRIYCGDGRMLTGHLIITDEEGTILDIQKSEEHDPASVRHFDGIITPGFINTHCHLELSHMKGKADTGTGLLPFLRTVVGFREVDEEIIQQAIIHADAEMYRNGIVAVGDISNKTDTVNVKSGSKINYYNFIEMFDFLQPSMTNNTIQQYAEVYDAHGDTNNQMKSYVPHAPYTVSPQLFEFIRSNNKVDSTLSIHNQETSAENELFMFGTGAFQDFYNDFGFNINHFNPNGKSAIHYAMENLDPRTKTLFVHNTQTVEEDIYAAHQWSEKVYWATCANANLYIENRLPDYQAFVAAGARMTIGTDSLTSNWQLSVWEEIKTIKKYCSYLSLDTLIRWACLNGAEALSFDHTLGSIVSGKTPGLVWIPCTITEEEEHISDSNPQRII